MHRCPVRTASSWLYTKARSIGSGAIPTACDIRWATSIRLVRHPICRARGPRPGRGEAEAGTAEVIEAEGLHALPGLLRPHVHPAPPARSTRRTLETGTLAPPPVTTAAVIAMANTDAARLHPRADITAPARAGRGAAAAVPAASSPPSPST